jgi:alpha-D-ribose 1-methylphosphonate 5-triphosphate synthase subunit PhnH
MVMTAAALSQALAPGFADAVLDQQRAFRAVMDALARPASLVSYISPLRDCGPLGATAAAIGLTLLDFEVRYHLGAHLASAEGFLTFHTGSARTHDPREAAFAFLDLTRDPLDLASFAQGEPDYPDRSTTIVALVGALEGGPVLSGSGPGIPGRRSLAAAGLPADFAAQWQANAARSPLGVDLILVTENAVVGLPRSTRIMPEPR